jgi:hypothetical protein
MVDKVIYTSTPWNMLQLFINFVSNIIYYSIHALCSAIIQFESFVSLFPLKTYFKITVYIILSMCRTRFIA